MKKIMLTAFIAAGMLFTSCNDDDNTTPDNGTKVYLPVKMSGDGYNTTFSYNDKGQVTKIVEDEYVYTFTYSGDELVGFVSTGDEIETTYSFSQEGNTITLNAVAVFEDHTYNDSETLEVDEKGNLLSDDFFTYTYDEAGNNIKASGNGEDSEVATMTFDTKNGIFKNLTLPKWVLNYLMAYESNAVNNMVTFDFVSENYPEDNNSGILSYEYNEAGYPVKATATSTDNTGTITESQTIEYIKK